MSISRYRSALLEGIQREWQALLAVVEQLPPDRLETADPGGWSPLDNLGHLTEWMKVLLGYHLDGRPGQEVLGLPDELAEPFDYNKVNAFLVERDRGRPPGRVLEELRAVQAEVIARLEAVPFESLLAPRFPDSPDGPTRLEFVLANTSDHFREHRLTIEKALRPPAE